MIARARMIAIAASFGAIASAFYACAIYDASLLVDASPDGSAREAGLDAGAPIEASSGDGAVINACAHATVPPAPTTEDGSGDVDVVLAATYLRFLQTVEDGGPPHPSPPRGFDLDNVCTCPGPESCTPLSGPLHCDGDGGTDDTAGNLFATFAELAPDKFSNEALNKNFVAGTTGILVRIRSYNGGQNDKQITVIVYASNGINGHQDGGNQTPVGDGTDVWTIDPSSLLGGTNIDAGDSCEGNDNICVPIYADTEAYVTGGVVVAHLDFPITVGAAGALLTVKLSDTVLSGPIILGADGHYRIDEGQVAGRWNTDAFLTALATVHDPLNKSEFLCGDAGTYLNLKKLACHGSDVNTNSSGDNAGKPCDALSIAVSFAGVGAHLGPIYNSPPATGACGADWKDDCTNVQ